VTTVSTATRQLRDACTATDCHPVSWLREQVISALPEAAESVWDWLRRLAKALLMVKDWGTAIVVALPALDVLKLVAAWTVVFSNPLTG
jgi:hypothetical protein